MTESPLVNVGDFLDFRPYGGGTVIPALVTRVQQSDRGDHIIPELRYVTHLTLTLFQPNDTVAGVPATFSQEFDRLADFLGRAWYRGQ